MTEWPRMVYEKIKHPVIKTARRMGRTANQVTILNNIVTLLFGGYFFSRGTYSGFVLGLAVCLINGLLDYLDGDLARIEKKKNAELGQWLDSGFDCVVQNAILGAIAMGCYKQGLPLIWVVLFFIGNASSNYVSFFYNTKFGFDSAKGNAVFRKYMIGGSRINSAITDLIDPTGNQFALTVYTYRYFIAAGCLFNIMPILFILFTVICNIRWFIMYVIYALYLHGGYAFKILKALSILDEESDEFYRVRNS